MTIFAVISVNPWVWKILPLSNISISSPLSFLKDLKVLSYVFHLFVWVSLRCLWLLQRLLIFYFLSQVLCHLYIEELCIFWVNHIYPTTSIKVFINCGNSLVEFYGLLIYTIILPVNKDILLLLFLFVFLLSPSVVLLL